MMEERTKIPPKSNTPLEEAVAEQVSSILKPLGFEVVSLEVHRERQKKIQIFMERILVPDAVSGAAPGAASQGVAPGVTLDDCTAAAQALSEPLDRLPEMNRLFGESTYELEVSSPGVNRPLKQERDFDRFTGQRARIHVFRPLAAEEIENGEFQKKNPKQKNFLGVLRGITSGKIRLELLPQGKPPKKTNGKRGEETATKEVKIPVALVSKAHLEPDWESLLEEKR